MAKKKKGSKKESPQQQFLDSMFKNVTKSGKNASEIAAEKLSIAQLKTKIGQLETSIDKLRKAKTIEKRVFVHLNGEPFNGEIDAKTGMPVIFEPETEAFETTSENESSEGGEKEDIGEKGE